MALRRRNITFFVRYAFKAYMESFNYKLSRSSPLPWQKMGVKNTCVVEGTKKWQTYQLPFTVAYYEDALSITKKTHKGNKGIDLVSLNQTFDHIELLDIIFINQQKMHCRRDNEVAN